MDMEIELVARVEEEGRILKRLVIVLIGLAAVVVALLATLQLDASERRQVLEAEASRAASLEHASDVSTQSLGALGVLNSLERLRTTRSIIAKIRSYDPGVRAVGETEARVFTSHVNPQVAIEQVPSDANLPEYAQRALSADNTKRAAMRRAETRKQQQAEDYANRERTLEVALFFAAIATGLLALGGLTPSKSTGRLCLVVALVSLVSSSALGIGAIVG